MSTLGLTATGAALEAIDRHLPALLQDRVASRLGAQDADLWGAPARDEAAKRLGWIDLFEDSRALVPHIAQLTRELRAEGVDRVVLAGMGGSSLAPEVIAATAGVELEVLDSTDPLQVSRALERDLERTVLVVSSKSGSTVETDSQRRVVEAAFRDAGIDPRTRLVAVTDPGSPLHAACESAGWRAVFTADPTVGGRFSALTAFGLVPTGLAGVDVAALLDDAEAVLDLLIADDEDNPGLQLGAALGGTRPLRDKLVFADHGSGIAGLPAWIEQLIAESTGKDGTGLLPVVVAPGDPETAWDAPDLLQVQLVGEDDVAAPGHGVQVACSLGAQLLLWEVATAVAGRLLGINPFDQPDVEAAKAAARTLDALLQSVTCLRMGGRDVLDGADTPRPGIEWAGYDREFEEADVAEQRDVEPRGRIWILPATDGASVGLKLPGHRRYDDAVAQFADVDAARAAVAAIDELLGVGPRG